MTTAVRIDRYMAVRDSAAVIAGCRRAVVRKIAAGVPAFVQMEREGILATLDSQHCAAEQLRPLIAHAAARSFAD